MKNLSTKLAALVLGLLAVTASAQTAAPFGGLPLYFEAGSQNQFLAHGRDAAFSVAPTAAEFALRAIANSPARAVQMQFIGANPHAEISGGSALPGRINYFTGNDPAQWRANVPTFAQVRVGEIYPGINLVYYGSQQQLEYDFILAAGADPGLIAIRFDGADKISINAQGGLVLKLGGRSILQPKPQIYQTVGGERKQVSGGYKILDAHSVAFTVGHYDRALPLVIDPVLGYSTYFGGTKEETAWAVAVSPVDGSVYVAGQTLSEFAMKKKSVFGSNNVFETDSPFSYPTNVVFQNALGDGRNSNVKIAGDGFVARFDATGTNLIFLTYLGGYLDDLVSGIAVDATGRAFVTGFTDSSNFPVVNALYPKISGQFNKIAQAYPSDSFVAELDPTGSQLIFSTFFGADWNDSATGIAVDLSGNVYITGTTGSTNFPVVNAVQSRLAGTNNVFVAELGAGGSPLIFSTYLGGNAFDAGEGIALDPAGNIFVCGFTDSTNFPTVNSTNSILNAGDKPKSKRDILPYDAFVARFMPSGAGLAYATLLGSTNDDVAYHITADAGGSAYVTGYSASPQFPNTVTLPYLYSRGDKNNNGSSDLDVFLTKFDPAGAMVYSTLFGGRGSDYGYGVALDAANNVFVAGATSSRDFPTNNVADVNGTFRSKNDGGVDAFVTMFSATPTGLTAMVYSGYLGGKKNDFGYSLAVDPAGNVYLVGQTGSKDFPLINAFQPFENGKNDAFLTKILAP